MTCALYCIGCGSTGEAPFAGARAADVAPWEDLGAVTFCEGDVRLGAPGSAVRGFCAARPLPPAPCRSDADCASRERCTCAGCRVAVCDTGDDCGAGWVCSRAIPRYSFRCDRPCRSDGDCARGEVCPAGAHVCRGRCASPGDCQRGESCAGGECVVSLDPVDEQPCAKDADCGPGMSCAVQRAPGTLSEPAPLLAPGGDLALYVERLEPSGRRSVWRALSTADLGDALGFRFRFDPDAAVIAPGPGDGGRLGAPSVIAVAGGYLAALADGSGRIRRATSADGIAFTVDAAPLLAPAGTWDAAGLDRPALAPAPTGGDLLFYGLADRSALGRAQSPDGRAFAADPSPLLAPAAVAEPPLWRDLDAIADPFAQAAIAADGTPLVRLWFAARGRESGAAVSFGALQQESPNDSIGEAASLDGRAFVPWPFDPVFDRLQGFVNDHLDEDQPAVVALPGARQLLYYVGSASTRPTIGVARNPPSVQ